MERQYYKQWLRTYQREILFTLRKFDKDNSAYIWSELEKKVHFDWSYFLQW